MDKTKQQKIENLNNRISELEHKIIDQKKPVNNIDTKNNFKLRLLSTLAGILIFSFISVAAITQCTNNSNSSNSVQNRYKTEKNTNSITEEETNDIIRHGSSNKVNNHTATEKNSEAYRRAQKDIERAVAVADRAVAAHEQYKEGIKKLYKALRAKGYSHQEAINYIKIQVSKN